MEIQQLNPIVTFDEVFNWLNQFQGAEDFLSPFTKQWLNNTTYALSLGHYARCRALIEQLYGQLPALHLPEAQMDIAETALNCARIYIRMGDYRPALRCLQQALTLYEINPHNQAVTRWMIGCVYWMLPDRYNDALGAWQMAQSAFAELAIRGTTAPVFARWYDQRNKELAESIRFAIKKLPERISAPYSVIE
ncbi:MAG: tetratricopeptide repeat protein [Anaerolineales bacterium]|nr:tetratricopeptide repeat protein [Anaerolineales bacterium]